MMEDTEKTSIFVEKMADFSRYNVKKGEEDATLEEELEAVDNYIYILNVRFAGDIHFSKKVECDVENVRVPSMILQPVVENAVLHGILETPTKSGTIVLTGWMEDKDVVLLISDDGVGIAPDKLPVILSGEGNTDSVVTVLGLMAGAAFAHNFGLAASAEGPTANGKIAVVIGIVVVAVIGSINSMRKVEA